MDYFIINKCRSNQINTTNVRGFITFVDEENGAYIFDIYLCKEIYLTFDKVSFKKKKEEEDEVAFSPEIGMYVVVYFHDTDIEFYQIREVDKKLSEVLLNRLKSLISLNKYDESIKEKIRKIENDFVLVKGTLLYQSGNIKFYYHECFISRQYECSKTNENSLFQIYLTTNNRIYSKEIKRYISNLELTFPVTRCGISFINNYLNKERKGHIGDISIFLLRKIAQGICFNDIQKYIVDFDLSPFYDRLEGFVEDGHLNDNGKFFLKCLDEIHNREIEARIVKINRFYYFISQNNCLKQAVKKDGVIPLDDHLFFREKQYSAIISHFYSFYKTISNDFKDEYQWRITTKVLGKEYISFRVDYFPISEKDDLEKTSNLVTAYIPFAFQKNNNEICINILNNQIYPFGEKDNFVFYKDIKVNESILLKNKNFNNYKQNNNVLIKWKKVFLETKNLALFFEKKIKPEFILKP